MQEPGHRHPSSAASSTRRPGSRLEKTGSEKGTRHSHLVLLARRHATGYRNLLGPQLPGLYGRLLLQAAHRRRAAGAPPRGADRAERLPGGRHPARPSSTGRPAEARARARYYRELFGPDGFYLEVQDHGIPEQAVVNREIVKISRETGIPLVATNDIHYTEREDARAQDVLICIGTGKKVSEGKRMKFEHPEFYFKSGDEMAQIFRELPEAVANTVRIAEACTLEILPLRPQFPVYEVPAGQTPEGYLTRARPQGAGGAVLSLSRPRRRERLEYELSIIISMGFTGYFLIVWDFIHYRQGERHRGGPGRGSGAGSLVAYCLKITDIDPLKYGLLFERFLNPERVSMPDFDIDFCHRRRDEVISYVTRKYGEDKVGPDHHLRHAEGAGGHPRRGARARPALRRGGRHREARSRGPEDRPRPGAEGEPRAGGGGQPRAAVQGAAGHQPEAGGPAPPRLHARRGHRHRPRAADALRAPLPRSQDGPRLHAVHHGLPGGVRPHQDGLPRPEDPHRHRGCPGPRAEEGRCHRAEVHPGGRPGHLPHVLRGKEHRRLPVRKLRHAGGTEKGAAGQDRGPHRPERPLPARAHGAHRHVRGEQVGTKAHRLPAARAGERPEGDLRRPRLPGAGHGDGPGGGRLHPRPGGHPAPGHGKEEARRNAQDEGEVPQRAQRRRATTPRRGRGSSSCSSPSAATASTRATRPPTPSPPTTRSG